MKSTMIAVSLFVFSAVLTVRADELPHAHETTSCVTTIFAGLADMTFKKACAVVAAVGIISVGLYKLYEFLSADEHDDETRIIEQEDMLTLTDHQRKLIEEFAAAVDACDLIAIQAFDFDEFPIDIMLLLHWARMDVLAVHEQQVDREAIELYRHSIASALRGLAHPDDIPTKVATKDLIPDCA